MDRVHYAGHSILTGTAIAHALLDYAQALFQASGAVTMQLPTLNDDGSRGRSEILLTPSSQLISDAEASEHPDVTDDKLVAYMHHEADRIRRNGVSSATAAPAAAPPPLDQYDFAF